MPYSITTKDGITLQNIPDEISADAPELKARIQKIRAERGGADVPGGGPTAPSSAKGGVLGGAFMGLRDPIDAGAQLLSRGVDAAVQGINSVTGANLPRPDVANVDQVVQTANKEYEQSRALAGRDGIDLARIGGNIVNPVNRIIPMGGATTTAGVAMRAGGQGAISGAAQPVLDTENFAAEKGLQIGVGGTVGAAGGAIADKLLQSIGNRFASLRERLGFPEFLGGQRGMSPELRARNEIAAAAAEQGIDLKTIPQSILDDVRGQVKKALSKGGNIDAKALVRKAEGEAVLGKDAGLTAGQASRDPQAFTRDMDLRGIAGAGKPLADRFNLQNTRLIEAVGKRGAVNAPDAYDAGSASIKALQAYDSKLSAGVTDAYNKFRNSTGATIDVPLQPVAQRFGEALDTFGDSNIPSAVRKMLDGYGVTGLKQTKVFDLAEADKLIKVINANYDPMKPQANAAMAAIRKGLNEAIDSAAQTADGPAAGQSAELLRNALKTAKERFSLHDSLPALADSASDPRAAEAFVRTYVTSKSAPIDTVNRLVKVLEPDALQAVRRNVLADILEKAAPGAARGSDAAVFSQNAYNKALDSIGERKLLALFGREDVNALRRIGRVAEWVQKQPKGSAVNNSNTGAAVMNLLQGLGGRSDSSLANKLGGLPVVNLLRDSIGKAMDESAVRASLAAEIRPSAAQLAPEQVNALRAIAPNVGGILGISSAGSLR